LGIKRHLPVSFSRISKGISMDGFTPVSALAGGAMIGAAAALFLLLNGRIAGISGILGGLLAPPSRETGWRAAFVAGLVLAPVAYAGLGGSLPPVTIGASFPLLILAGLLVGFGSRLGAGCTSGHGVCGIGRGSPRSLAATGTFMAVAVFTVLVMRHLVGA
jgi:uncharacterized membrane protein YedE/YeeE